MCLRKLIVPLSLVTHIFLPIFRWLATIDFNVQRWGLSKLSIELATEIESITDDSVRNYHMNWLSILNLLRLFTLIQVIDFVHSLLLFNTKGKCFHSKRFLKVIWTRIILEYKDKWYDHRFLTEDYVLVLCVKLQVIEMRKNLQNISKLCVALVLLWQTQGKGAKWIISRHNISFHEDCLSLWNKSLSYIGFICIINM